MLWVLYIVFSLVSLLLIGLVLIQEGKGGGMGGAFGGVGGRLDRGLELLQVAA